VLADFLSTLQASSVAAGLRGSTWVYPLVNAGHIVGIALLFGAIVPLDLRLIGLWRRLPVETLRRVLVPMATAGFAIALIAGGLLFVVKATDYAASPLFRLKMLMLAIALTNALVTIAVWRTRRSRADAAAAEPTVPERCLGATSLIAWLAVLVLGRLVGYF
jgi:hypothetical protein